MSEPKNDAYYLQKILRDLHFIQKHMSGVSVSALEENEILLDSMMFRLVQIQENTKKLTEAFRMAHGDIPWKDISGLRNRIIHDYGNVDLGVVYAVLTEDVPWLIEVLEKE